MPFEFFRFILTPKKEAQLRAGEGLFAYGKLDLDLSVARINKEYKVKGDTITVISNDATDAVTIQLNTLENAGLDLRTHRQINSPYIRIFISNVAQPGKHCNLTLGGDGAFDVKGIGSVKVSDATGADVNMATSDLQGTANTKLDTVNATLDTVSELTAVHGVNVDTKLDNVNARLDTLLFGNRDTFKTAELNVTTAGTALQCPAQVIPNGFDLLIKGKSGNTGKVYIGESAIAAQTHLIDLDPGQSITLKLSNMNQVWVDADVNGEGVVLIVEV